MGCGKSKHAVETATTVIKSSINADGSKQTTTTTKTAKETNESSLIHKTVETKSLSIEEAKKEIATAEVDSSDVTKTDNVVPTLGETVDEPTDVLKEDLKVKDSDSTDNVVYGLTENVEKATEVVTEDETVKDLNPTDPGASNVDPTSAACTDDVVPTSGVETDGVVQASSKEDVGSNEVVKEDEGEKESTLNEDIKVKTDNLTPLEELKMDNKTKIEFLTPTLSEDVVGPFEVGKGNVEDLKEKNILSATSDENPLITNDDSSNTKDDKELVALAVESTKVEAKKEEDVEVTKVETEKASTASKANVEE